MTNDELTRERVEAAKEHAEKGAQYYNGALNDYKNKFRKEPEMFLEGEYDATFNYIENRIEYYALEMTKSEQKAMVKSMEPLMISSAGTLINLYEQTSFDDVKILIIKKLGSLREESLIEFFDSIVENCSSQKVRKEAVSSIGRLRDFNIAKKYLKNYLQDSNPEIVLQAIRGLIVFKKNKDILKLLMEAYETSENEVVLKTIEQEFSIVEYDFDTKNDHPIVDERLKNRVIHSDVRDTLKVVDNNSIHLTFTSPPYYNARDYSIYKSYSEYLNFLKGVFKEVHRVTKDGRFLIVNTSPIIIPRAGRKYSSTRYPIPYDLHNILTAIGWVFIDDIHWVKPDASVKNRIGGFTQHRKPLMYKPNGITEQLMVYRKKSNRLLDWNIRCYPEKIINESLVDDSYERTNIWEIEPVFDKGHSAVFPYELCDRVVKYYSFKGDLVFDPFAGSGTLGKAAIDNGRSVLLTEISYSYFNRIKENLKSYTELSYHDFDEFVKLYRGDN